MRSQPPKLDMAVAVAYKNKVVKQLTGGVGQLLKANGVDYLRGHGRGAVADAGSRHTHGRLDPGFAHEQTDPGQWLDAHSSAVPGIDGRNVIFSDDALSMSSVPASLVCIGGGMIAVELACMLNAFGTEVTIVEMLPAIIANEDDEVKRADPVAQEARRRDCHGRESRIDRGRRRQEARDGDDRRTASKPSTPNTCWWRSAARRTPPGWMRWRRRA